MTHQKQLQVRSDLAISVEATVAPSQSCAAGSAARAPLTRQPHHQLSGQGVGELPLVILSFFSNASPVGNPGSFGKPSKKVCEHRGLQFPSPVKAMERALQGLSAPEPVGTAATAEDGALCAQKSLQHPCGQQACPSDLLLLLYFNLPAGSSLETALFRSL